jgi:hypothetical protein
MSKVEREIEVLRVRHIILNIYLVLILGPVPETPQHRPSLRRD